MQYGVTEMGCVWVTEPGCVCYTETKCVGLLKKDTWATVAKVRVTKTGRVHVPVGHRNGVCGLQKLNVGELQKEAVCVEENECGLCMGHSNEKSEFTKWNVYETGIFSNMKMVYFYGASQSRVDNDFS
jgi:hypothetical protein